MDLDVVLCLCDPPVFVVGSDLPTVGEVHYISDMFLGCVVYFGVVHYVHDCCDHYGVGARMEIFGYASDGGGEEVRGDYDVLFDCG